MQLLRNYIIERVPIFNNNISAYVKSFIESNCTVAKKSNSFLILSYNKNFLGQLNWVIAEIIIHVDLVLNFLHHMKLNKRSNSYA